MAILKRGIQQQCGSQKVLWLLSSYPETFSDKDKTIRMLYIGLNIISNTYLIPAETNENNLDTGILVA